MPCQIRRRIWAPDHPSILWAARAYDDAGRPAATGHRHGASPTPVRRDSWPIDRAHDADRHCWASWTRRQLADKRTLTCPAGGFAWGVGYALPLAAAASSRADARPPSHLASRADEPLASASRLVRVRSDIAIDDTPSSEEREPVSGFPIVVGAQARRLRASPAAACRRSGSSAGKLLRTIGRWKPGRVVVHPPQRPHVDAPPAYEGHRPSQHPPGAPRVLVGADRVVFSRRERDDDRLRGLPQTIHAPDF